MQHRQLFWLHIKKSAGTTTRSLLKPHYVEVEREKKPITFIQASPEEYNDILNNFRVVLGEYQFKRCLFAQKFLYPNNWDRIYSFAFSREPVDRCISMFYYLFWTETGGMKASLRQLRRHVNRRKFDSNTSYAFDVFLNYAHEAQMSDSIYHPLGLNFTTHTAPMWDDITDYEGNILLTEVFRLEKLIEGINQAFEACGIDKRLDPAVTRNNKNIGRKEYRPTKSQLVKIRKIYPYDFEIYEQAWH